MAIQSNGLALIKTPDGWGDLSTTEFTTSFFLRVDAKEGTGGRQFALQSNNQYYFYVSNNDGGDEWYKGTASQASGGNVWNEASIYNVPLRSVAHVVISFSSVDTSKSFISVNGTRFRSSLWDGFAGTVNLAAAWTFFAGQDSTATHLSIENVLLLDRVLTDAEITDLQYDPDGTIPTLTADTKLFYSFKGTVGGDVATGDPGITIEGDATRSLVVDPAGGGTLKYVTPFTQGRQVEVGQLYVGTSGTTITLATTLIGSGKPAALLPDSVAGMTPPVFKLNGVEITGLSAPYTRPDRGGFLWFLPPGTVVVPGDAVTADVPDDWVSSSLGGCTGMTNRTVANRVGMPSAEPSDGLLRVGTQPTGLQASYLSSGRWHANLAKFVEYPGVRRPDGSPRTPFSPAIATHATHINGDAYGFPRDAFIGKWVVAWDDYDHANPFTDLFLIGGGTYTTVTELTEYANVANPSTGEGRVRVFDVQPTVWSGTLASGGIDATTTTIPLASALSPNYDSINPPAITWVVIDDEKILVGSVSGPNLVGCTRGFMGTTAASHAAGAAVAVENSSSGIGVELRSTHPTEENRRFKNLRVYMPGDWTVPATPGPVTLGPEDHCQLNAGFKRDVVDHGLGVIRNMETFGTFGDGNSEIEHLPVPEDGLWAYCKRRMKWSLKGAKRLVPAGRYFYFNEEFQKTETYTATLAAAIDAVTTSVRITTTDGERIPFGQTLFIDGERMRIAEPLPAAGDDRYTVARARMGTVAAPHAAGTAITVGWRMPITDKSQYSIENIAGTGKGFHYFEGVLDEENSLLPLQNGLFADFHGGDDVNVQARRSFTLTAPFGAADTVMHVTVADEADWDWIQPKGWVHLNGERMVVRDRDPGEGTITVVGTTLDVGGYVVPGRTGSAGDLPADTVGTHTSGGVLFESDDGTQKQYCNLEYSSLSPVVTGAASALFYIQADPSFGPATASWNAVDGQDFATDAVVKPDQSDIRSTYTPGPFYPPTFHAKTCSAAKAHAWVNFPYGASDDMIWEVAKLIFADLSPGLKVHVSSGNELWLFMGGLFWAAQSIARSVGLEDGATHYVLRVLHVGDVFKRYAATIGREDDVLITGEWQLGGLGLFPQRYADLATAGYTIAPPLDRIADAPYLKPSSEDADAAFITLCGTIDDDAQLIDLYQFDFEFSTYYGNIADAGIAARDALNTTYGWHVERCHYEGGTETASPIPSDAIGGSDEIRAAWYLRALDCLNHPNMRHYERSFWEILRRNFGSTEIAIFCHARPTAVTAGTYKGQQLWGQYQYQGQQPGRGDGTDGKADNRLYKFRQGVTNSTDPIYDSPARHVVSTRGQAMLDYSDKFFGALDTEFSDDFDGDLAGWTDSSGRWSVVAGKATYDGAGSSDTYADVLWHRLPGGIGERFVVRAGVDQSPGLPGAIVTLGYAAGDPPLSDGMIGYAIVNGLNKNDAYANRWLKATGGWTGGGNEAYDRVGDPATSPYVVEVWQTRPGRHVTVMRQTAGGPILIMANADTAETLSTTPDSFGFRPWTDGQTVDSVAVFTETPTRFVYIEGDSIAHGGADMLGPHLGTAVQLYNNGMDAHTVAQADSGWDSVTAPILASTSLPITYLLQRGTNDFNFSVGDPGPGSSVEDRTAAMLASLKTSVLSLIAKARATTGVDQVVACTLLPVGVIATSGDGYFLNDQDISVRQPARDAVQADYRTWLQGLLTAGTIDGLVDFDGLTAMDDPTDTDKYGDKLHPTQYGHNLVWRYAADQIELPAGSPPVVVSATILSNGTTLDVVWDKSVTMTETGSFTIAIETVPVAVTGPTGDGTETFRFTLPGPALAGQSGLFLAEAGKVQSGDGALNEAVSEAIVNNSTQTGETPTPISGGTNFGFHRYSIYAGDPVHGIAPIG